MCIKSTYFNYSGFEWPAIFSELDYLAQLKNRLRSQLFRLRNGPLSFSTPKQSVQNSTQWLFFMGQNVSWTLFKPHYI